MEWHAIEKCLEGAAKKLKSCWLCDIPQNTNSHRSSKELRVRLSMHVILHRTQHINNRFPLFPFLHQRLCHFAVGSISTSLCWNSLSEDTTLERHARLASSTTSTAFETSVVTAMVSWSVGSLEQTLLFTISCDQATVMQAVSAETRTASSSCLAGGVALALCCIGWRMPHRGCANCMLLHRQKHPKHEAKSPSKKLSQQRLQAST